VTLKRREKPRFGKPNQDGKASTGVVARWGEMETADDGKRLWRLQEKKYSAEIVQEDPFRDRRGRQLPRRLDALKIRAERAKYDPEKDRKKVEQVEPYALERIVKRFDRDTSPEKKAAVEELRGMIEEFRMSLFAPEVKTAFPIFAKRLALKIKEIEAMG